MLYTVNRHSGIPAYRQIIEQIRLGIAGGLLEVGAEVPSTRALSAQIGTNPMTVSKAYGILEREGVLLRRPGLPLVVAAGAGGDGDKESREKCELELKRALEPAAKVAVQLGVSVTRAKQLMSEAMNAASKDAQE